MAKAGRGDDQYMVRFPPGLRDRIKAYAEDHGRSINSEIIRVLEREFPEPLQIDTRITQMLGALQLLKAEGDTQHLIESLVSEVRETLEDIASGRVTDADEETRKKVQDGLARWKEEEAEAFNDRFEMSLDDEEIESLNRTGRTEKF